MYETLQGKNRFPTVVEETNKSSESLVIPDDTAKLTKDIKKIPERIPRSPAVCEKLRIPSLNDSPVSNRDTLVYPKPEIVRLRCTPTHVHMKTRSLSAYESSRGLNSVYMNSQVLLIATPSEWHLGIDTTYKRVRCY